MTKREEYNLKFYKRNTLGFLENMIDTSDGIGLYKKLYFIDLLDPVEVDYFLENIELIENNQPYEPDFLVGDGTQSQPMEFIYPNVIIDHDLIIHMNDFKELLLEWKDFINT